MTNWLLNLTYPGEISKNRLERVEEYLSNARNSGVSAGYSLKEKKNPGKIYKMYFQSEDYDKIIIGREGLTRILGKPAKIKLKIK